MRRFIRPSYFIIQTKTRKIIPSELIKTIKINKSSHHYVLSAELKKNGQSIDISTYKTRFDANAMANVIMDRLSTRTDSDDIIFDIGNNEKWIQRGSGHANE